MHKLSRRQWIQAAGSLGVFSALSTASAHALGVAENRHGQNTPAAGWDPAKLGAPLMRDPVWVYDNWSAYAEGLAGKDNTPLTEALAMAQLDQLIRLKRLGVHFDYYMMNAFWYAPDGAYREWRKPNWPNGPDRWIASCLKNGIKPGLWFGTNSFWKINLAPQWQSSLADKVTQKYSFNSMSLHEGSFLADFMTILAHWYDRGVRLFEFDVANFDAATPATHASVSVEEIRERNRHALSEALKVFRRPRPDVMLVAFNDFGGDLGSTAGPFPFKKPVDLRWLEVFDTLYSGDTRASDVPQANFWRSVDLYNDHMVRRYEQSGVPLERIDPFFTLSSTWFGYHRGKQAWKGALLLTLARGSWKKTIYGDLSLLDDDEVNWFAKVQKLYAPLLYMGRTKTFGGIPGEVQPYGFASFDLGGALYTVVNPAQQVRTVELPLLSAAQSPLREGRILFRDAGFVPDLRNAAITVGPGQMAVIGFGRYATADCDLGVQKDVVIPRAIEPLAAQFRSIGKHSIEATIPPPKKGDLRMFFQQRLASGEVLKTKKRGEIEVIQGGKKISIKSDLIGKEQGFGELSWSAGEIERAAFVGNGLVTIRYTLDSEEPATLEGRTFQVTY